MKYNKLTKEEERVILRKGTEVPFTGKYYDHSQKGIYICKRCSTPLFYSSDKFDSRCGWPSFDDNIDGSVKITLDADGKRMEIVCNNCNAHLGHIFTGEGFTEKNTRYCVNSISLNFVSDEIIKNTEKVYFAGGCFWGIEYFFKKAKGVISTTVGYIGGNVENPIYKEVCSGSTGHAEVVEVIYNSEKTNFEELAKLFFEIHDFTQIDRQGPDIGEQYRSEIFYTKESQKNVANKLMDLLIRRGYEVSTDLTQAGAYYKAEDYHQDYYNKKNKQPVCHTRRKIF